MLVAVPLAGELRFYPFDDDFRVSFGTPVFFIFLLWMRSIPSYVFGFLTGVCVVLFRIGLDWTLIDDFQWMESFILHSPVFFYYQAYAMFFSLLRINSYHHLPLVIGCLGVVLEVIASIAELAFRYPYHDLLTIGTLNKIIIIALFRSFFVIGFFNLVMLRQSKLAEEQQRKRNEDMMLHISNLYEETIQLKKSMQHAEDITRDCYTFYRHLKDQVPSHFAKQALKITGQVHEIKKDHQRIYAGLKKLTSDEPLTDYSTLSALGHLIVKSNENYAQLLGKQIHFQVNVHADDRFYHSYTILSLMNNLVSNAVESIANQGTISMTMMKEQGWMMFRVEDNGQGIKQRNVDLIFEPGYTTKYDVSGKPSTGMGLTYVKEMTDYLNGQISVKSKSEEKETTFQVNIPCDRLVKEC